MSLIGVMLPPLTEKIDAVTIIAMVTASPEQLLGPLNDVESKFAPDVLYAEGHIELLRQSPRVAIVGSREASELGFRRARSIAKALAGHGAIIVSGLARGIDTFAHQAAIQAGGKTIAVLGTPLNIVTPKSNESLQREIMTNHLAISQFAAGARVQRGFFPMRNRTMALVCQASIIIEAGESSGTLSQGWEALRLGRPLFITEEVVEAEHLTWPTQMLDYGAQVLYDDIECVIDSMPLAGADRMTYVL